MKKIVSLFLVLVLFITGIPTSVPTSKQSPKTVDEVYKMMADLHLMKLNEDGTIELSEESYSYIDDNDLYNEFLEKIDAINYFVELGIATVDQNFDVTLASQQEVTEIIYKRDQEKNQQ